MPEKNRRSSEGQGFTPVEWLPPAPGSPDHGQKWELVRQLGAATAAGIPAARGFFLALCTADQLTAVYLAAQMGIVLTGPRWVSADCACRPLCAAQWAALITGSPAAVTDLARAGLGPGTYADVMGYLISVIVLAAMMFGGGDPAGWLCGAPELDHDALFG